MRQLFTAVQNQVVASVLDARNNTIMEILAHNLSTQDPGDIPNPSVFNVEIYDDNWTGYVKKHPGESLRPFVQHVADMYGFLAPRNETARNNWIVDARCPTRRHELRRRGATEMDGSGRWQSIDTQSFHALRANRWIGCYFREYTMGWGWIPTATNHVVGDSHVDNPPENFSAQDFWRWVRDNTDWNIASGRDNPLANSKATAARQRWQGGGLQSYFDLPREAPATVGFSLKLVHPGPEGLSVTTRSSAESFFDRPVRRPDGFHEQENLFRPYWQARLRSVGSSLSNTRSMP